MVNKCVIHTCNTIKAGDGVTLHRLPADPTARGLWFRAMLNQTGQTVFREEDEICSKHFTPQDFNIVDGVSVLRLDAVPFNSYHAEEETLHSPKRMKRDAITSSECSVFSCSNAFKETQLNRPNLIYYPFPKDKTLRASWKQFCNKTDDNFSYRFVCSDHFTSKDFESDTSSSGIVRSLKPKAVPSIYKAEIKYEDLIEEGETGVTSQNAMELEYAGGENSVPFVAEDRICAIEICDSKSSGRSNIEYYPNLNNKSRKKRFLWTKSSEGMLLICWKEHLNELRKAKRNSHVYVEMAKDLNALGVQASPEEIKTKVGNLTLRYRANRRVSGNTGGTFSDWSLYSEVHEIIGNFECNDTSLGDESIRGEYRSDLLSDDTADAEQLPASNYVSAPMPSPSTIKIQSTPNSPPATRISTTNDTSASALNHNSPSTSTSICASPTLTSICAPPTSASICAPPTSSMRESGKKKQKTASQEITQLTEVLKSRMDALIEKSSAYDQLLIKEFKRFNDIIEKRFNKDK